MKNKFGHLREFNKRIVVKNFSHPYFYKTKEVFNVSKNLSEIFLKIEKDEEGREKETDWNTIVNPVLSEIASSALSKDLPLWKCFIIHNYYNRNKETNKIQKGMVFVWRFHHCISDGVTAIKFFFTITEPFSSQNKPETNLESSDLEKKKEELKNALAKEAKKQKESAAKRFLKSFFKLGFGVKKDEENQLLYQEKNFLNIDSKTSFSCTREEFDLAPIKKLSKELGVSVNDIVESVSCAALRKLLLKNGTEVDKKKIQLGEEGVKGITWVSLFGVTLPQLIDNLSINEKVRPNEKLSSKKDIKNMLGSVIHPTWYNIEDHQSRILAINKEMRRLAVSFEAPISFFCLRLSGMMFPCICRNICSNFLKTSWSFSNVMGPLTPRSLCGRVFDSVYFSGSPQASLSSMGFAFSYNGKLYFSFNSSLSQNLADDYIHFLIISLKEHLSLLKDQNNSTSNNNNNNTNCIVIDFVKNENDSNSSNNGNEALPLTNFKEDVKNNINPSVRINM